MLYLTEGISALLPSNLRPSELEIIEEKACNYVDFIYVIRENFASIIAFRKAKRYRKTYIFIKEIKRVYPALKKCFTCDYYGRSCMGGYKVIFDDRDLMNTCYWYNDMSTPELWRKQHPTSLTLWEAAWEDRHYLTPHAWIAYTREDLIRLGKSVYKYFDISPKQDIKQLGFNSKNHYSPWGFLEDYMECLPTSEFLLKVGFGKYANSRRICRQKAQSVKKHCKFIAKYAKELSEKNCAMDELIYMIEHEQLTTKGMVLEKICKRFKVGMGDAKEIYAYLKKQPRSMICEDDMKTSMRYVEDYADFMYLLSTKTNDFTSRGARFPRDFHARMVYLKNLDKAKPDAERNIKLNQAREKLGLPISTAYKDGFELIIPSNELQFLELGERLSICVGSCGYADKMINGKSIIIGAYKDGNPVNCIELEVPSNPRGRYKVLQNRGEHNQESPYQKQVAKIVSQYMTLANKQWRSMQNAVA